MSRFQFQHATFNCPFKCSNHPEHCIICAPFHPVNIARHESNMETLSLYWEARVDRGKCDKDAGRLLDAISEVLQ